MIVSPVFESEKPGRLLNIIAHGKEGTTVTVLTESPPDEYIETITTTGFARFDLEHSTHTIEIKGIPYPVEKNGIRVTATEPVVVFVCADDSDGYTAIARRNSTSYVAASFTASHLSEMADKSYTAIAAFEEGTEVTVRVRYNEDVHEVQFGGAEYRNNDIVTTTINAHDVMFLWGFNDMTGTQIVANKPVSVFAGATCAHIPVGSSRCQALAEQMIPNDLLQGDVLNFPVLDIPDTLFRVVSVEPTTNVVVGHTIENQELAQPGSILPWHSSSPHGQMVSSNKTVINVQYQPDGGSTVWPLQTTMLPFGMFSATHTVFALPGFDAQVVIIASKSLQNSYDFVLDDQPMTNFTIEEVHSDYVAVWATVLPGLHIIRSADSQAIAVYVYGYGTTAAYSFHGACTTEKLTGKNLNADLPFLDFYR